MQVCLLIKKQEWLQTILPARQEVHTPLELLQLNSASGRPFLQLAQMSEGMHSQCSVAIDLTVASENGQCHDQLHPTSFQQHRGCTQHN